MSNFIENVKLALESCGPERRWKSDTMIDGSIVVGNGHFFVALTPAEFAELGCEFVDMVPSRVDSMKEQIAINATKGAKLEVVGEMDGGIDGLCCVLQFSMGFMVPFQKKFIALADRSRMTAVAFDGGFLLISRREDGRVSCGIMSVGNYTQGMITELMDEST